MYKCLTLAILVCIFCLADGQPAKTTASQSVKTKHEVSLEGGAPLFDVRAHLLKMKKLPVKAPLIKKDIQPIAAGAPIHHFESSNEESETNTEDVKTRKAKDKKITEVKAKKNKKKNVTLNENFQNGDEYEKQTKDGFIKRKKNTVYSSNYNKTGVTKVDTKTKDVHKRKEETRNRHAAVTKAKKNTLRKGPNGDETTQEELKDEEEEESYHKT